MIFRLGSKRAFSFFYLKGENKMNKFRSIEEKKRKERKEHDK